MDHSDYGTGGYSSAMIFDKSNKKAIIVLSNRSALVEQRALTDKLAFALMEDLSL